MESEVRFYYPLSKYDKWVELLKNIKVLNFRGRNYEKTSQFNHPMKEYDFYYKDIDGRLRVRVTKGEKTKCMVSWKRRLPTSTSSQINQEEEVELTILEHEFDNLQFLINNVLHLIEVESYERYRTVFDNDDVEVVLDEYPFGLALEIEAKNKDKDPQKIIDKYVKLLNLKYEDSYRLSWDDKYLQLCSEQGYTCYKHVLFNMPMPKL